MTFALYILCFVSAVTMLVESATDLRGDLRRREAIMQDKVASAAMRRWSFALCAYTRLWVFMTGTAAIYFLRELLRLW
jgi:hypothetical protein